jgi:hypothetical protein
MGLFLFRFWPVIIPLVLYMLWLRSTQKRAVKNGEEPPHFRDGPLYWLAFATLGMGVLCFFWLGVTIDNTKGEYVPPHVENGVMVPGKIKERE